MGLCGIASVDMDGVRGVRGSLLEALRACDWVVLPWCMVKVKWEGKGRRINSEIDFLTRVYNFGLTGSFYWEKGTASSLPVLASNAPRDIQAAAMDAFLVGYDHIHGNDGHGHDVSSHKGYEDQ
ncbi:hypothetical protein Tco_1395322 [Tanacetum coccineum]